VLTEGASEGASETVSEGCGRGVDSGRGVGGMRRQLAASSAAAMAATASGAAQWRWQQRRAGARGGRIRPSATRSCGGDGIGRPQRSVLARLRRLWELLSVGEEEEGGAIYIPTPL
jgi:hypothetical protein